MVEGVLGHVGVSGALRRENVRDDNYALQVIARLKLNGASGRGPAAPTGTPSLSLPPALLPLRFVSSAAARNPSLHRKIIAF